MHIIDTEQFIYSLPLVFYRSQGAAAYSILPYPVGNEQMIHLYVLFWIVGGNQETRPQSLFSQGVIAVAQSSMIVVFLYPEMEAERHRWGIILMYSCYWDITAALMKGHCSVNLSQKALCSV